MEKKFENLMKEWKEFESKGGTGEEFIIKKVLNLLKKKWLTFT